MLPSDVAELPAGKAALVLADGHEVGQNLAGMAVVSEAVDDGNGTAAGESLYLGLIKGADHDAVQIAAQDAGGVFNGLTAADLQILGGEEEGAAAQLIHAGFEGNSGTGGGLLENHTQGLALQVVMLDAVLLLIFELIGQVQDLGDLSG